MKGKILIAMFIMNMPIVVSAQLKAAYWYQGYIDKITALQERVRSNDFKINPSTFDLTTYLSAFDKLTLQSPGMKPAFYYDGTFSGTPPIFLIPENTSIDLLVKRWKDEEKRGGTRLYDNKNVYSENNRLSSKFRAEDSPMGYFQLALWRQSGQVFAFSKCENFYGLKVISSPEVLKELVGKFGKGWGWKKITASQWEVIQQIDPTPKFRMELDRCIVQLTVVRPFHGIFVNTFSISRSFPHIVEKTNEECLWFSNSFIMF